MFLVPQVRLQYFDKWEIDFVGLINPPEKMSGVRYIITTTNYLTRRTEAKPIIDCSVDTIARFIFEDVLTRFGCPIILMSGQGNHFLNKMIVSLKDKF
jgi:hypothetical protein